MFNIFLPCADQIMDNIGHFYSILDEFLMDSDDRIFVIPWLMFSFTYRGRRIREQDNIVEINWMDSQYCALLSYM